ncbi:MULTISPECIES: hypothetical protein [unclassified Paenibacillus]|uniref:hypothetical protein n=1 Tax=unclassified Paenibacillus TaxID=185978 RepID=UPI0030EED36F
MASNKMVFKEDEVERLQTKIRQVSQDTNRLYLQLKGQINNWDGIPLGSNQIKAQVLINELTVEAEKLEDIIRSAVKGVQGVQDQNKRQMNQLFQQFGALGSMFGRLGGDSAIGQFSIPPAAQKAVTNLITSIAALMGKDELDSDPMVKKLQTTVKNSGLGTIDSIAAQSKLKDIYQARNQIAKAQTAYEVYQAFGNRTQMDAMHKLADDARKKLESLGIGEVQYQLGKNLSANFKRPAVQACDYDPSITTSNVPLLQNEEYLLLLRMALQKEGVGEQAKSQLAGKRLEIEQAENQLKGKSAFDFSEYDKKLMGNTWVLSKNGVTDQKAAQASIAYQEAIRNGDIQLEREEPGVDIILEQTIAATEGYNYFTGEKISKLQAYSIIISGILYNFQGISVSRGGLNKNLKLPKGSVKIPKQTVKTPVIELPEVKVQPSDIHVKAVEGTGNVKPVQQINNRFPNDIQTGKEFSFNIENGYLKNNSGLSEVDFVVDMNGKLHIGRGHSFLANGESVQAAGKLKLNNQGQVRSISNLSGHYTPSIEQAKLFSQVLEQIGVKTKNAWLEIYTIETTPSGYVNTNELVKISSIQIK